MNQKTQESKNKILKVIYYDENAAMDYVTIMNDGNITIEEINKAIEGLANRKYTFRVVEEDELNAM